MSSICFDWQARRFVEVNLNFFVLEGLRVPAFSDDVFRVLASAAARLSCVDERFAQFAATTGVECGPIDEAERIRLRVDIDARVAHAWGLTSNELELVFEDFTEDAVTPDYREAVKRRFAELT